MCRVLDKLKGKEAEELLAEYAVDDSVPVNLNQILLNIGLSALPKNFADLEKSLGRKKGDILGLIIAKGGKAAIFFKKDDPLNHQRCVIAHELAHCCLHYTELEEIRHIELREDRNGEDAREREAEIFAGQLLIPVKRLREIYLDLAIPDSITLANKFAVSTSMMEERLDYLKISYINKDGQTIVYENE